MSQTYVTVAGNVANDPTVRVTSSQHTVVTFRLAQNHRRADRSTGELVDSPTNWYSVSAWRGLGTNVASSVSKGDPVVVHGRLKAQEYQDKSGTYRTWIDIEALHVGHDLRFGRSAFEKVERPGAPEHPDETELRELQLDQLAEAARAEVSGAVPEARQAEGVEPEEGPGEE